MEKLLREKGGQRDRPRDEREWKEIYQGEGGGGEGGQPFINFYGFGARSGEYSTTRLSLPTSRDIYTGRYRALYPTAVIDIQVDIELYIYPPEEIDIQVDVELSLYPPAEIDIQVDIELSIYPPPGIDIQVDIELSIHQQG
jgi:hypothetical protein